MVKIALAFLLGYLFRSYLAFQEVNMDPNLVDAALGFRVTNGQMQYIEDGHITHVRPASNEEIRMYRTLVAAQSKWPVQDLNIAS